LTLFALAVGAAFVAAFAFTGFFAGFFVVRARFFMARNLQ
jgi:hypothetical protein